MAEQLAFQQTCRNCGAIHFHKRTGRSVTALANGFCNQFLASAGFPVDQHRGVGRGHNPHHAQYAPERVAVTDIRGSSLTQSSLVSNAIFDDFVSSISKHALWLIAGDSIAEVAFAAIS
jgi:hypothetical protein